MTICGGTFLTLLVMAKTPVADPHKKKKGISYKNSDDDLLEALIQVAFPEFIVQNDDSFHTTTNKYKKCLCEAASGWPISHPKLIAGIENENNDLEHVKKMKTFLKSYIVESELPWLVNKVIKLILNDDSAVKCKWMISEECYVEGKELCSCEKIYSDYFLWSVWKYIIIISKHNKANKSDYRKWLDDTMRERKTTDLIIKEGKIKMSSIDWNEEIPESIDEDNEDELPENAVENNDLVERQPIKSSYDIMTEQMRKSAQVIADTLGAYFDNLVKTDFQKNQSLEVQEGVDILYESSLMKGKLWQRLKNGVIKPNYYIFDMDINSLSENEYYEFNEKCFLRTVYIEGEKTIEVIIRSNDYDIVGYTSSHNWKAESSRNRAIGKGSQNLRGIFKVEEIADNHISVQYLYFGEEV